MTADPKKDNEITDEDLNQVAGGIKSAIHRPDDSDRPVCSCGTFVPKVAPIT